MNGNRSETATFTQDQYTVTLSTVGNGSATADPGWTFAGWSGDAGGNTNPLTITMDSNKNITATFTQDQYTLTVNTIGNGSVAKSPDQPTYLFGDQVTLTATAAPGWTFAGWTGDASGDTNPLTVTM